MSSRQSRRKKFAPATNPNVKSGDAPLVTLPQERTSDATVSESLSIAGSESTSFPKDSGPKSSVHSEQITLWLRRADQLLLGFLLISLLALLIAMRWKLSGTGGTEIEIVGQQPREYFYSIDINRASWVEWAQLDGIGEKLARRIVGEREGGGPFRSIDDVGRVRGLGPKLIEKLRPFLKCIDDETHVPDNKSEGFKELR